MSTRRAWNRFVPPTSRRERARTVRLRPIALAVAALAGAMLVLGSAGASWATVTVDSTRSDPRAVALAKQVLEAMGGREAWEATRYVSWRFFDRRTHYWDRWTGDVRIEAPGQLILMNVNTKKGRAWVNDVEVTSEAQLEDLLRTGYAWWINDSYWVFMPYKLLDPGVILRYGGQRTMENGRPADVLVLTFDHVGLTPQNRYDVLVDRETHLVGEWSFYEKADDPEPRFTMPWDDWKQVGRIMLAGSHGRGKDWKLAVYDSLPRSVFESYDPVRLQ